MADAREQGGRSAVNGVEVLCIAVGSGTKQAHNRPDGTQGLLDATHDETCDRVIAGHTHRCAPLRAAPNASHHGEAQSERAPERLTEHPTVCIVTAVAVQAQATEETTRHTRHRVRTMRQRPLIRKSGFVA